MGVAFQDSPSEDMVFWIIFISSCYYFIFLFGEIVAHCNKCSRPATGAIV